MILNKHCMNNFELSFYFDHHHYEAEVKVIQAKDHIQYTISPKDEHLLKEYGTQVVHKFHGESLQAAFPGSTEHKKGYSEVLVSSLQHFLREK